MKRRQMADKQYNTIFYLVQFIGVTALIVAWAVGLPYLFVVPVCCLIAVMFMVVYYGMPSTPDNLRPVLRKYIDIKRFLGRHLVASLIIITQPAVALIWTIVLLAGKPPNPPAKSTIIIMIVISDIVVTGAVAVGMMIGKRLRGGIG